MPGDLANARGSAARAWATVAMVFLFILVNYADKAVVGLSSVPIMHELRLTNVQFGELGSAFFLLFSLSGIAGGFLADRMRTKTLMSAMALVWACALLPLRWVSSFGVLLASRIVLGAAEGPAFPVALHAVFKWFPDRERALPTSIVACGAALFRQLVSSRTAIGVFVAGFAAYWLIALNITWLANYLIKALHLTPNRAAWIVGLPSVLQMALAPSFALLSQWLMRRGASSRLARGVLGASCVTAAGLAMMTMALLPVGAFKVLLIGVSFSLGSVIFTLGSTLIGEISPGPQRGAMLGVTNSVQTLAGLCAPVIMGRMVDVGGNPEVGFRSGYVDAGLLVVVLGVLAAILIDPDADLRRFRRRSALPSRE